MGATRVLRRWLNPARPGTVGLPAALVVAVVCFCAGCVEPGGPLPPGAVLRLGAPCMQIDTYPGCAVLSNDCRTFLINGRQATTAWDVASGQLLWRLPGENAGLALAPDGKTVAVAAEGCAGLYSMPGGRLVKEFRYKPDRGDVVKSSPVNHAAFSHDGRVLAVVYRDEVQFWDTRTGKMHSSVCPIPPRQSGTRRLMEEARSFLLMPDGNTAAIRDDKTVRLLEVPSGKELGIVGEPEQPISFMAAAPDGKHLLVGYYGRRGYEEKFDQYDVATFKLVGQVDLGSSLPSGGGYAGGFLIGPRGRTYVYGFNAMVPGLPMDSRPVPTYRLQSPLAADYPAGPAWPFDWPASPVPPVFSRNGKVIGGLLWRRLICLWDAETGQVLTHSPIVSMPLTHVRILPDGSLIAAEQGMGISRWDAEGRRMWFRRYDVEIRTITVSTEAGALAVSSSESPAGRGHGTLELYSLADGQELPRPDVQRKLGEDHASVYSARFAPDGKTIWTAQLRCTGPRQWDVATGELVTDADAGKATEWWKDEAPYCYWVRPDLDLWYAAHCGPSRNRLCAIDSGQLVRRANESGDPSPRGDLTMIFNPDMVTVSDAWTDRRCLDIRLPQVRHNNSMFEPAAAFSPDERLLVVAVGNLLHVFDALTGRWLCELSGHTGEVLSVSFRADGKYLASAGEDGTCIVWDMSRISPEPQDDGQDVASLWEKLAGEDVPSARQAAAVLGRWKGAAEFVASRVLAGPVDWQAFTKLLAQLDGEDPAVRERAGTDLAAMGYCARVLLHQQSLKAGTSDRVRREIERIMRLPEETPPGEAERAFQPLRMLRAIAVLEDQADPASIAALELLARRPYPFHISSYAAAALGRIEAARACKAIPAWQARARPIAVAEAGAGVPAPAASAAAPAEMLDCYGDPLPPGARWRIGSVRMKSLSYDPAALVVSSDNRTVVSSGSDGTKAWDAATGSLRWSLPEKQAGMTLSPDGGTLAISTGCGARLYGMADGKLLRELGLDERYERGAGPGPIAFSPDGAVLVVMTPRGMMFCSLPAGKLYKQRPLEGKAGTKVLRMRILPDGKTLVALTPVGIRFFHLDTAKEKVFEAISEPNHKYITMDVTPDGKFILAGFYLNNQTSDKFDVYDIATRKLVSQMKIERTDRYPYDATGAVTIGAAWRMFLPGRNAFQPCDPLATAPAKEAPLEWPVAGLPAESIKSAAFSPDGKVMAGELPGGGICLWDAATGKLLARPPGALTPLTRVCMLADGSVVTAEASVAMSRWDAAGKRLWSVPCTQDVVGMEVSSDGKTLLATYDPHRRGRVAGVFDLAGGGQIGEAGEVIPWLKGWVTHAAFDPDGHTVWLAPHSRSEPLQWDPPDRRPMDVAPAGYGAPSCMYVWPGLDLYLQSDKRRLLRSVKTGVVMRAFQYWPYLVCQGDLLAGRDDGGLAVFEPWSGSPVTEIGRGGPIAVSPDQRLVASGFVSHVLIHDLLTGKQLADLVGHGKDVTSLSFSPDGKSLASGSKDTTCLVWDLSRIGSEPLKVGKDPNELWAALGGADIKAARSAVAALRLRKDTTDFIRARVLEGPAGWQKIGRLIKGLDDDDFKTRDKAHKDLLGLCPAIRPLLGQVLPGELSIEVRVRMEKIVKDSAAAGQATAPAAGQAAEAPRVGAGGIDFAAILRAIGVLAAHATPAAASALAEISRQPFPAYVRSYAAAAARRIAAASRPAR